jgi:ADP-ribosyl-[dinitrogen reductase] hydrolase
MAARQIPPRPLDRSPEAVADRARGCLLGLALGDALGTTLEFAARDAHPRVNDLVGGGPFGLKPGQWTDDTAMALALGDSLQVVDGLDERDLMERFVAWYREGRYSCTGTCFDIGVTTRQALERFRRDGDPIAGSTDPRAAGNGSLMRLAPVALRFRGDRAALVDAARRQSRTTHEADEAIDACAAFAELLAEAIDGARGDEVLAPRPSTHRPSIASILAGSWRAKTRAEIASSGYVVHTLEAALWCVARTTSFRDAVVLAANLGDDADTVAAVTGQLAGALWGAASMPAPWLDQLAWRHEIESLADQLVSASGLPQRHGGLH